MTAAPSAELEEAIRSTVWQACRTGVHGFASEWVYAIARAITAKHIAPLLERNGRLVTALDSANGTPCEQIRHQQAEHALTARAEAAERAHAVAREALGTIRREVVAAKSYAVEEGLKTENAVHIKLDMIDGYARAALADAEDGK